LLSVCRLTPRKGVDRTLEAVARLTEQYPKLIYAIVGDGDDRGRLTSLVQEKGLTDRVLFAGRVSDADLLRFYARCDLLVLASREEGDDIEGFGLVLVEAGAFGKPVIGGDSGGVGEAVAHEENGLLVDPQSPLAIAQAIDRILGDRSLALRLGREGQRRATEVFTWERCRQALITALGAGGDSAWRRGR
jgi:phosphatidylinositol alpha-1,6-mannosyltransferase